jgi:hypothetical protein
VSEEAAACGHDGAESEEAEGDRYGRSATFATAAGPLAILVVLAFALALAVAVAARAKASPTLVLTVVVIVLVFFFGGGRGRRFLRRRGGSGRRRPSG